MALIDRVRAFRRADRDQQKWLKSVAMMGGERQDGYRVARDYKDGRHRVQLTAREKTFLQASGFPYAENYCETIVDIHVARLKVRTWASLDKDRQAFSNDLWVQNRMGAGQMRVYDGAIGLGDFFVIVEPGEPGELPELCLNDPHMVKVKYDSGEPLYGVKVWDTCREGPSNPEGRDVRRMNIYWPDRVEKWFALSVDGDWVPWRDEQDENAVVWTMDGDPDGEPIGINVIHFANKPSPHYGRSILRSVIPQQDALNKECIDHFWVMDAQGWPQQWGAGVPKEQNLERHPGSLWTTEAPDGKFGQLEPADPRNTISSIESTIARMASRSSSPLHLMLAGGNLPSGETLKTSESGLTSVSKMRQGVFGGDWQDVERIACRVHVAFGGGDRKLLDATVEPQWERPDTRNEVDEANTAILWQTLGVSRSSSLSRLGFDPDEETKRREAEGAVGDAAALLDAARKMQAPTPSEQLGGGRQPAQDPASARVPT